VSAPARVDVGTYAKYNSGSIEGAWLDLKGYISMHPIPVTHDLMEM